MGQKGDSLLSPSNVKKFEVELDITGPIKTDEEIDLEVKLQKTKQELAALRAELDSDEAKTKNYKCCRSICGVSFWLLALMALIMTVIIFTLMQDSTTKEYNKVNGD